MFVYSYILLLLYRSYEYKRTQSSIFFPHHFKPSTFDYELKKEKQQNKRKRNKKQEKNRFNQKTTRTQNKTIMTKNIQRLTVLTLALFVVWQHGNLWKGGRRSNRINVKYFKTIFPLWYIFRLSYITKTVSLLPFKEKSSAKLSKVSPKMNQREVDCDGLQMYLTSHWSTNRY